MSARSRSAVACARFGAVAAALLLLASPAGAQMPPGHGGASGAPSGPPPAEAALVADADTGTVTVRVVGDGPESPVAAVDVTLRGGSGQRVARTDGAGLARFTGLEVGARHQVTAAVGEATLRSQPFAIPAQGGVSIVLSTAPPSASAAASGRPNPRQMSGISRPQQDDPGGQLTVRPVQGDLVESEFGGLESGVPVGATLHLVGLHATGEVSVESVTVAEEDAGRVRFQGLDRGNQVSYYVLGLFPRAGGVDRLMSQAIGMPPEVGLRLMLAGHGDGSASPPIDDLERHFGSGAGAAPEPGVVAVKLFPAPGQKQLLGGIDEVELVPAAGGGEVRTAPAASREPGPEEVVAQTVRMKPAARSEAGEVSFLVVRPSLDQPIEGVEITLRRADAAADAPPLGTRRTTVEGTATFADLEPGLEVVASAAMHGKTASTEPFTVSADEAVSHAFAFEWPREDLIEATFEGVPSGPEHVYVARARTGGRELVSPPFQLTESMGASVPIFVYPEILFRIHGGAQLDDEKLWFQVRMSLANPSVKPHDAGGKGLSVPLPAGFVGASVDEEMTLRVKVESDKGFVWRGPFPPGQRDFVAQFALPVVDGRVEFDMPLPHGMTGGRLVLEELPGMEVDLPDDAQARPIEREDGRRFVELRDISIPPGQRLVFAIEGLPQRAAWQRWVRIAVGLVVVSLLLWILWGIFAGRGGASAADAARRALQRERERLLDQLAELEADRRADRVEAKLYESQRTRLMERLEELYRELDGDGRAQPAG